MIKKIRVANLEPGMYVADFNTPWLQHPFLTRKRLLRSANEIRALVDRGIHDVYIDTVRGRDSVEAVCAVEAQAATAQEMRQAVTQGEEAPSAPPSETSPAGGTTPFDEELRRAGEVYGRAKELVRDLLHDARMGRSIDGKRTAHVVQDMADSIFRNHDALASLSRLKSFDDYTFHHSVNVAVLSLTLGKHLGLVKGELLRLGIGAILHDVGKVMIPVEILGKPGPLTEEEFALMKTHTLHGARVLGAARDVPKECAAVALNHHERFNGGGYPRGLQGMGIGKFGLVSAIADVYDAMTSERVYRSAVPAHQALQRIYEWAGSDFYPIFVQKFIQCVGIYPVGSVVRLDTGEIGVVWRQNRGQSLRPWVRVVRSASGAPEIPVLEVDLREPHAARGKAYSRTVEAVLEPRTIDVDVDAVLDGRHAQPPAEAVQPALLFT